MAKLVRTCPLCGGHGSGSTYPWQFRYRSHSYLFHKCCFCKCAFVDPVPDEETFSYIYEQANYHVNHYVDVDLEGYRRVAKLLARFAKKEARVLDYGCGWGYFLQILRAEGFDPVGIEFSRDAAETARFKAGCAVHTVSDLSLEAQLGTFDVVYLGDVLEHLPHPAKTITELTSYLRPGGLVIVDGPLEINPSPVYWVSFIIASIKRLVRPSFFGDGIPGHLFRCSESQQRMFFKRVLPFSALLHWETYESGWPYTRGGLLKRLVAGLAKLIGGRQFMGVTFGNRFITVIQIKYEPKAPL